MSQRDWDLICLGRAAVDLYAEQIGAELEDASSFSKYLGGCAANVAVGASRLGLRTAMLTRVGTEAMGRFVRKTLSREGVDVSLVSEDSDRLTGLVLLGVSPPDHFPLIFYRENCADMAIALDDFSTQDIGRSRGLLLTGTHFSQPQAAVVSVQAARWAKEQGTKVILDIDFRPVLWNLTGHADGESRYVATQKVRHALKEVLPLCDLIVGTEEEICIAAGEEKVEAALGILRQETSASLVVKKGPMGCVVFPQGETQGIQGAGFPVKVLNVLGAGDAFLSGFLRAWLRGETWETCGTWANACGALVVNRHACAPAIPFESELLGFLSGKGIPELNRRHRCLSREHLSEDPLAVLAFDHRIQLEELVSEYGQHTQKISEIKNLIFQGLKLAREKVQACRLGLIIDDQYGSSVLAGLGNSDFWIGRCIEDPGTLPLDFLEGSEAACLLRQWPQQHTVKALVYLSSDEPLMAQQIEKIKQLDAAAEQSGQPLLLELIPEQYPQEILDGVSLLYNAGIAPAWWKLPPCSDAGLWQLLQQVIDAHDPNCYGVLILGQGASLSYLTQELEAHSQYSCVKGFAVGRSIWWHASEDWLRGQLSDTEFSQQVAYNFIQLIDTFSGKALSTVR